MIMNFNAKGIVYVALEWIFILVQITVITLRLYSRSILTRSMGSDDLFIVIAFVCFGWAKAFSNGKIMMLRRC